VISRVSSVRLDHLRRRRLAGPGRSSVSAARHPELNTPD
jgi:hypothetical protein